MAAAAPVVHRLNRGVRSLQTDLRGEGATSRAMLVEKRQALARRLLTDQGRSIGPFAFPMARFGHRTFARASRRIGRMFPGRFEKQEAGGVAPPALRPVICRRAW